MKKDLYRIYHKFGESLTLSSKLFTNLNTNDSHVSLEGEIIWRDRCRAKFIWKKDESSSLIVLTYQYVGQNSDCLTITQEIEVYYQPSNLGLGYIPLFVCPFTRKRCRTLILAGNSKYFRHRSGYRNLYYASQIRSKRQRVLYRYHDLNAQITQLISTKFRHRYKGKSTRQYRKLSKLRLRKQRHERTIQCIFLTHLSKRLPV